MKLPSPLGLRALSSRGVTLVLGLMLLAAPASALPITYTFTGTVSQDFTGNPLGAQFSDGQSVTGTITVDPSVADGDLSPGIGAYLDSLLFFEITIGSYTASAIGGSLDVFDDTPDDGLFFGAAINEGNYAGSAIVTGAPVAGLDLGILALSFMDTTDLALGSDAFPTGIVLGDWVASGYLGFQTAAPGYEEYLVGFNLETFSQQDAVVPEPGTFVLLGSACLGLLAARRRRARARLPEVRLKPDTTQGT
jgi:hypothetical protein